MSTTIPLTLIEGAMALPRLRPLGHLPAPFGRDWALLPPGHSLRAELKALYAALLRTFCLNAQTIRSICQWETPRTPPEVPFVFTTPAASTAAFDARLDESAQTSAAAAASAFAPVSAPAVPAARSAASLHWGAWGGSAWGGGACALGGAAMLAWIALGHPSHQQAASGNEATETRLATRDAQVTRSPGLNAATAQHAAANSNAPALGAAPSSKRNDGAPSSPRMKLDAVAALPRHNSASVTPTTAPLKAPAASPRVTASNSATHRRDNLHPAASAPRDKNHRNRLQMGASARLADAPAMNGDKPPTNVPAIARSTTPKTSAAGAYSPIAPSPLGIDDYASITLSAGIQLRHIAPPARAAQASQNATSGATDWTNHLSQRRVTDVPDQFAK